MHRSPVLNPRVRGMICLKCGKEYPVGDYFYGCPDCRDRGQNSAVTFRYEGEGYIDQTENGWARYRSMLPYDNIPTLGEGNTPVLDLPVLAKELGVARLFTKNEFQNPTGSHKDRMNPFIVARAADRGFSTVTCASSGNEAASLAAYAAAAGLSCVNVSTESIPEHWKRASDACGARLVLTSTSDDRLSYQREHMGDEWYPATNLLSIPTSSSAWGIQGYKTISYELYDRFGRQQPGYILVPTCRGDLLYGIFEGYVDLARYGYLAHFPRLVACEPNPRLELVLEQGHSHTERFAGDTSATSSIGGATTTWQAEFALRKSGGFALSVSQKEAVDSVEQMARHGLYLETSSSIVYPCLRKAVYEHRIPESASVLMILTSHGYKNG